MNDPTAAVAPQEAAPAADVRNELNVMFDTWQRISSAWDGIKAAGLDAAGQARVTAWLKDHLGQ